MRTFIRIIDSFKLFVIKKIFYFNLPWFMKLFVSYYQKKGMHFTGQPNYISNTVFFDGNDYSLIAIGNGVTISKEVSILTHDGSIRTLYVNMPGLEESLPMLTQWHKTEMCCLRGKVTIGDHTFIGAKAFLLPGTEIGSHCIIGAGSVVKGKIPDYTVVYGNPSEARGDTRELVKRKLTQYLEERQGKK